MKEPNLQRNAILSFLIHLTFILITVITLKHTNHLVKPSSYMVNLVGSDKADTGKDISASSEKESVSETMTAQKIETAQDAKEIKQYAEDRIAALQATRKAKQIVGLRKLVSIKSSSGESSGSTAQKGENGTEGNEPDSYESRIGREISQHYTVPELKGKNLKAIISVTIMQDGRVKVNKIEKGSGNVLFDRSVLRAITKASPVTPPPYEMEIGLRFTP